MQRTLAFAFLLIGAALSQTTISLNAGVAASLSDSFFSILGLSVSSSNSVSLTYGTNVNAGANVFAGANSGGAQIQLSTSALFSAVNVYFQSSVPTTLTVTSNPTGLAQLLTATVQLNLFVATTGASGQATLGAVPYTTSSSGTYTYTLNLDGTKQSIVLAPFDTSTTKISANGGSGSGSGSGSNTAGSASFNYAASFYPVALNHNFNLQSGYQYAYGDNIQVTPTSGNSNFQATFNGAFSGQTGSSSSTQGPANSNGYFNSYYTFSGSGSTNVLQWKSGASNTFAYANGTTTSSAAWASANANAGISWYKSSTGNTAASGWSKVSSSSSTVNGQVAVYATVGSYSQWTVGAGSGAVSLSVAGLLVVSASVFAMLF